MKTRHLIVVSIFLVFAGLLSLNAQQTAEQLYLSGLYKEEIEGDLNAAIKIYETIIDKYPDNRPVGAKTYLHLGLCYEKLGLNEAQKAYRKVLESYPEQKPEVAIAKENLDRLLAMKEKQFKPTFRKVRIPTKLSWSVRLSPDGKNLGLVSDAKIYIMPLSGNIGPDIPGPPVQLNTNEIPVEYTDLNWSADGKWIAFNDPGMSGPNQGIYVMSSTGGNPKKVLENYRDARIVNYRLSLSPDGKILAFTSVEENKQHIYTIPVLGGNPARLVDLEAREPAFSPDGKYIAFVKDKELGAGQGGLGLWIVPAAGSTPTLVAQAGTAASPVWSPDGEMIAFLDYSTGGGLGYSKQINLVRVSVDGKPVGEVNHIDLPEGIECVRMLAGWTPDNKIGALCMTRQEFGIYTLPAEGGQAAMILPDYALQPRYSNDGKRIIFTTVPKEGDNKFRKLFLASVSSTGGKGYALAGNYQGNKIHSITYQGGNRISPDGKWIISAAWTPADSAGIAQKNIQFPHTKIWKLAVDGSEAIQLTNPVGSHADFCPSWSPDGSRVAFIRTELTDGMDPFEGESGIYITRSSIEAPELLTSSERYLMSAVWSPDGTMIAYLTGLKDPARGDPILNIINVNSHESKIVGKVPAANVNIELAWSPDSKRIAFNGENINVMNIEDGTIEEIKTNLVDTGIWHLDWSTDGKQFVFAGGKGGDDEFYFMENFLPE